jgi:hypothetical protein
MKKFKPSQNRTFEEKIYFHAIALKKRVLNISHETKKYGIRSKYI